MAKPKPSSASPAITPSTTPDMTKSVTSGIESVPAESPASAPDASTAPPAPTMPPSTPPDDADVSVMADMLADMTPDALARLRTKLAATDIGKMLGSKSKSGAAAGKFVEHPDGSVDVLVHFSSDTVSPLKSWAESAGKTLEEQIQEIAEVAVTNYVFQDWGAMASASQAAAATPSTPAAVPGVPVGAPPAASK